MDGKIKSRISRKLIVSMNITLDGFLSGPQCELDWHFSAWTTDMAEELCNQLEKADTLLFGRVTYMAMANHWKDRALDFTCPTEDRAFVQMMNSYIKYVFTNTLTQSHWDNSVLVQGTGAGAVIEALKAQDGSNIIVYGSGKLVSTLMHINAVDEYHLWIHPITIRTGKRLFNNVQQQLRLKSSHTFRSGVVLLIYEVVI